MKNTTETPTTLTPYQQELFEFSESLVSFFTTPGLLELQELHEAVRVYRIEAHGSCWRCFSGCLSCAQQQKPQRLLRTEEKLLEFLDIGAPRLGALSFREDGWLTLGGAAWAPARHAWEPAEEWLVDSQKWRAFCYYHPTRALWLFGFHLAENSPLRSL